MMFVFYWMALAFGGLVTVLGFAFLVLALFRKRSRRVLLALGLTSLFAAWVPIAVLFAILYASGARPAGGRNATPQTSPAVECSDAPEFRKECGPY